MRKALNLSIKGYCKEIVSKTRVLVFTTKKLSFTVKYLYLISGCMSTHGQNLEKNCANFDFVDKSLAELGWQMHFFFLCGQN